MWGISWKPKWVSLKNVVSKSNQKHDSVLRGGIQTSISSIGASRWGTAWRQKKKKTANVATPCNKKSQPRLRPAITSKMEYPLCDQKWRSEQYWCVDEQGFMRQTETHMTMEGKILWRLVNAASPHLAVRTFSRKMKTYCKARGSQACFHYMALQDARSPLTCKSRHGLGREKVEIHTKYSSHSSDKGMD